MNFMEIACARQSCRSYEKDRDVEAEKITAMLEAARLAPSACNGQPYKITVCRGKQAKKAARAVSGMGMNKFAVQAPILMVISEMPYGKSAALGAKVKGIDYRSIDIGILAAYLTAEATAQGLLFEYYPDSDTMIFSYNFPDNKRRREIKHYSEFIKRSPLVHSSHLQKFKDALWGACKKEAEGNLEYL